MVMAGLCSLVMSPSYFTLGLQDVPGGTWVKGTQDLSVSFLTSTTAFQSQ